MKDVFLIYPKCCFYEIVILSYFMNYSHCDLAFCTLDGKPIQAMEGFSVQANLALADLDQAQIRSFIVPGGNISEIDRAGVQVYLRDLKKRHALIAGICAGVDVLDHAGILDGVKSTHSTDADWIRDKNIITARANAYVDFAIEVAKYLGLFTGEEDLQETIDFWKHHHRMQ